MSDPQESQKAFDQDSIQFIKTARQFVDSAMEVGSAVAAGKPAFVSKEVKEARLEICKTCEYRVAASNPERDMCNGCGCFILTKASFAPMKCPKEKWGAVE